MFRRGLKSVIGIIERIVAVVLVVMIGLALIAFIVDLVGVAWRHPTSALPELARMLDEVLTLFILIELFLIALAYLEGRRVIRTVLEATLVAVARKIIAFEPGDASFRKGAMLALLLLTVAASWFLLDRVGVSSDERPHTPER